MTAPIVVTDLVKEYGPRRVVDGVSFRVEPGEVYGLLGPNGAGKSTTVEILEGHRPATSGTAEVLGVDPSSAGRDHRDRIGIVLQQAAMEDKLTVTEIVRVHAACYRRPRPVDECVELVGLTDAANQRFETLSGGQKRRLDLATGIVGRPDVLFLDEPTTGFDPAARRGAWAVVRALCTEGTTVLLTSHYLDEVEHLADRVGVLMNGRLVAEGTPAELTAGTGATAVRFELPAGMTVADVESVLTAGGLACAVAATGAGVALTTETPTSVVHAVTGWAVERGVELAGLTIARPTLEDMFLRLVDSDGGADD